MPCHDTLCRVSYDSVGYTMIQPIHPEATWNSMLPAGAGLQVLIIMTLLRAVTASFKQLKPLTSYIRASNQHADGGTLTSMHGNGKASSAPIPGHPTCATDNLILDTNKHACTVKSRQQQRIMHVPVLQPAADKGCMVTWIHFWHCNHICHPHSPCSMLSAPSKPLLTPAVDTADELLTTARA